MKGFIFSLTLLLPVIIDCSPRSPRDRKTKSPGTLGCASSDLVDDARFSPSFKRKKKGVRISDKVSLHEFEKQTDDLTVTTSAFTFGSNTPLSINPNAQMFESIHKTSPGTPITSISTSISKASLKDTESPQSVVINLKPKEITLPQRPILKKLLTRNVKMTINLFRTGTAEDLKVFYAQGTQLPHSEPYTTDLFIYLFQTEDQRDKLKLIYLHDRQLVLDFIVTRASEIPVESLMSFASMILDPRVLNELEHLNPLELRVTIYLYDIQFKIDQVYKVFNELIEDELNEESHAIARALVERFYRQPGSEPLLIYAARTDTEETFLNILDFDPEDLNRLDSEGCSVVYHAAAEGNLGVLETLKSKMAGKAFLGRSPLVAMAIKDRDDSLQFFLDADPTISIFTDSEIEEAAFASAKHGSFRIVRLLSKTGRLNLYCHDGSDTLLSIALKADQIGYSKLLVERLGYNVNFVGEDLINPEGHALRYILTKHDTVDFFLKCGANRNLMVPPPGQPDDSEHLIPLSLYLETCNDTKLIKIFNKKR